MAIVIVLAVLKGDALLMRFITVIHTEIEACFFVMVELMTILGEYRDSIVLVGGWLPYFLIEKKKFA